MGPVPGYSAGASLRVLAEGSHGPPASPLTILCVLHWSAIEILLRPNPSPILLIIAAWQRAGTSIEQDVVFFIQINALASILQMRTNHVLSGLHTAAWDSGGAVK